MCPWPFGYGKLSVKLHVARLEQEPCGCMPMSMRLCRETWTEEVSLCTVVRSFDRCSLTARRTWSGFPARALPGCSFYVHTVFIVHLLPQFIAMWVKSIRETQSPIHIIIHHTLWQSAVCWVTDGPTATWNRNSQNEKMNEWWFFSAPQYTVRLYVRFVCLWKQVLNILPPSLSEPMWSVLRVILWTLCCCHRAPPLGHRWARTTDVPPSLRHLFLTHLPMLCSKSAV